MSSSAPVGRKLLDEAWAIICQATEELARDLGFTILEWHQFHPGQPEGYILGWAQIALGFQIALQGLVTSLDPTSATSQDLADTARKLVVETIRRLRPNARLVRGLMRQRVDPTVEIVQYLFVARHLYHDLRDVATRAGLEPELGN